jgi:predicted permease
VPANNTIPPERWVYTVPMRLRALFRRRQLDQDLDEELQLHLEEKTQELIDSGMSAEEAHFAALRDFGNVELTKQNCRDTRKVLWLQNLLEDLRFSVRMLRKNPGFTAVALLTIALGIGVNTAIFSVVNAVLLRPLPFEEPKRLVFLRESSPEMPGMFISLANLADWQSMNKVFENMGGFRRASAILTGNGDPQRILIGQVSSGLFPTLGVAPILGRNIKAEEDSPDGPPAVVLSERFWTRDYNRDSAILGKQIKLTGQVYTVVGVVPTEGFPPYWQPMEMFTPLGRLNKEIGGDEHRSFHLGTSAYARLKPGVTLGQARADMLAIARQLEQEHPKTNAGQSVMVQPLWEQVVGEVSRPLELLMGSVLLVLLIACANVASLLTSRAIVRRRELAIRGALGAGTTRLAAQLLCETTFLALIGGGLGLLAAFLVTPVLAHHALAIVPRAEGISIDGSVLAFTFVVSLCTGVIFGVVPAFAAYRCNPTEAFKDGNAPRAGLSRIGVRSLLAMAELAMALVLLVTAGLTLKSLYHLLQTDLGMSSDGVLTGMLNFSNQRYADEAKLVSFVQQLQERLSGLPGVTAAGLQSPQLEGGSQATFHAEGGVASSDKQDTYAENSSLTPGAFQALGIRLLRGRFFDWSDNTSAQPLCIVDDTLATRYWPGQDAIGKRISMAISPGTTDHPAWRTIVGVVHRVQTDAADPQHLPEIFLPYAQFPGGRGIVLVRSQTDPAILLPSVRRVIQSLDPDMPLYNVRPLSEVLDENVAPRRLMVMLLSSFAGIALLLAGLGVYGVMAYMITGRTREIGLRLALGASARDIARLVLRHAVPLVVTGAAIGVVVSLFLKRPLTPLLLGVSATDSWTIAGVAILLIVVALAACYVPIRQAMSIDPVKVLYRE